MLKRYSVASLLYLGLLTSAPAAWGMWDVCYQVERTSQSNELAEVLENLRFENFLRVQPTRRGCPSTAYRLIDLDAKEYAGEVAVRACFLLANEPNRLLADQPERCPTERLGAGTTYARRWNTRWRGTSIDLYSTGRPHRRAISALRHAAAGGIAKSASRST